jgi:nucleoside-diphosphate-sugar epimerase
MAKRYVITGGGGFVGKALAKALRARGDVVVSLSRGIYHDLQDLGVKSIQVDIGAPVDEWRDHFTGADGVFHTAAKVDMWGERDGFFRTNVIGTRNVIAACRYSGVQNLVFTSSPSVIHNGSDLVGVNESYPYPEHFDAYYPETKALAEQEVITANDWPELKTVALRPHLIWGPDDTNLIPTILERARAGTLKQIGDGTNKVDLTYIDDCVAAHILAMEALERGDRNVCGKVYFISQGEPVNMWGWINQVLAKNHLPKITRSVPKPVALVVAHLCELVAKLARVLGREYKPLLTRFLVSEMSTHHYFSIEAAKRDLGYYPKWTISSAMDHTFGA